MHVTTDAWLRDREDLRKILTFLGTEKKLAERFSIPHEAFLPLFFSLRFGGDWCFGSEMLQSVSVVKKTTVYDDATGTGFSLEEIYLIVNPVITEQTGTIHRLEKCSEEEMRLLVERPYRVRVEGERIIRMTVNPGTREITTTALEEEEIAFEGSPAYGIAHEMEHLEKKGIAGAGLWEMRFVE